MFKKIIFSFSALFLVILLSGCQNVSSTNSQNLNKVENSFKNNKIYNWSTMDQGPYNDSVSLAFGSSPLYFVDDGRVLAEHASVPGAIYWQDKVWVYFVDVTQNGIKEQTGLVTSADKGQTWSKRGFVEISGLGDKTAVDPDPFISPDGEVWLYYLDIISAEDPSQTNTIYLATSEDGINFEEQGPVFQYPDIFDPDVLYVDGTYYLYAGVGSQETCVATSSGGREFEYQGTALTGGGIPNSYYDEANKKFYLYTNGIKIWESIDGLTYKNTGEIFSSKNGLTADPSLVRIDEDNYIMFYKTSNKKL